MRMNYEKPISKPVTIRVTFNGTEVLKQDFAVGDTPAVEWNPPPKTSGVVQRYQIVDGKEIPSGSATYWGPDFLGAQMLAEKAKKLREEKKQWQARTLFIKAARLFEKFAPNSADLAEAYENLWGICFFSKARPKNLQRRRQEALNWYEKQILVIERQGDLPSLRGNLTNLSVMYARFGDRETALKLALRGLKLARQLNDAGDNENIASWTQTSWHLIALGKLDQAEKLVNEGLKRFAEDPNRAFLWKAKSDIHSERARLCLQKAEELWPKDACPL
jgi:hypothetical protein